MSTSRRMLPVVAVTGSSIMVGCGGNYGGSCGGSYGSYGSYGSSYTCAPPINPNPSGFYEGTLSDPAMQQDNPVVAVISDNGSGRMSGEDGTYYRLNVQPSGNALTGSFQGFSQGSLFPNGNQSTSGSLSATTTGQGLSGTFTDQAGNVRSLMLNFDSIYNDTSSLPTLAGTWSYTASNGFSFTATIQTDGTFTGLDSDNCTYNGSFGLIDPTFDAYSETYVRTCSGSALTFTGLATYFPATSGVAPAQIKLFADDDAGEFLVADLE